MPTAFIPDDDQGQIRGYFTLPDGASLERSVAVMDDIRRVVSEEPLVRTGNFYAGSSFGQSGEDRGSFYLRLQPRKDRPGKEQSSNAIKRRLNRKIQQRVGEARVVLITPPTCGASAVNQDFAGMLDRQREATQPGAIRPSRPEFHPDGQGDGPI